MKRDNVDVCVLDLVLFYNRDRCLEVAVVHSGKPSQMVEPIHGSH